MGAAKLMVAIPTKERPEYLSVLLSSLVAQEYTDWELLILPNGDPNQLDRTIVQRMLNMLRGQGYKVRVEFLGDIGRSPAVAHNRAQLECESEYLLCLDDDMWLPPKYLEWMVESFEYLIREQADPVILCGVTPWMDPAWKGIGPGIRKDTPPKDVEIVELVQHDFAEDGGKPPYSILARQNIAYYTGGKQTLRSSEGISPANFMMRPDILSVRGDVSNISTFSDLFWSMQLKMLLGYRVWFDLRCEAWHVNAHSGGLRESAHKYDKEGPAYFAQQKRVAKMLQLYKEFRDGNEGRSVRDVSKQGVQNNSISNR